MTGCVGNEYMRQMTCLDARRDWRSTASHVSDPAQRLSRKALLGFIAARSLVPNRAQ